MQIRYDYIPSFCSHILFDADPLAGLESCPVIQSTTRTISLHLAGFALYSFKLQINKVWVGAGAALPTIICMGAHKVTLCPAWERAAFGGPIIWGRLSQNSENVVYLF